MVESAVAASAAASSVAAEAGFMAVAAGFITGWAFVIIGVLALLGILSEHNDSSGWALFWLILAGGVAYMAFNVPLMFLAIGAVAYIVIGLCWSFWRYKRYVADKVEKNKTANQSQRERVLREIHPSNMIGSITSWILVWPFSFVASISSDLIDFVHTMITKFFRGVYFRIYDAAVSALK